MSTFFLAEMGQIVEMGDGVDGVNYKAFERHFPGGPGVKNSPANSGGHWFNPWSEKIPHATE